MIEEIRLKGIKVTPQTLEERFNMNLTELEWKVFRTNLEKSWNDMEFGLEGVIVKHLTNSLREMGYKPTLEGDKLTFKKD